MFCSKLANQTGLFSLFGIEEVHDTQRQIHCIHISNETVTILKRTHMFLPSTPRLCLL
ncbi:hypothetical protein ACHAXM_011342 [Skeletonema potamos]